MLQTTQIQTVTPDLAKKYLDSNSRNRNLREAHIISLAKLMTDGLFGLSNDAIAFDEDGVLINGQHRMNAVIRSNTSQRFLVVDGLPEGAQFSMDRGIGRKVGDTLTILGFSNTTERAASSRLLHFYLDGILASKDGRGRHEPMEALEIIKSHPGMFDVSLPFILRLAKDLSPVHNKHGESIFFHYLFSQVSPELADDFFTNLAKGANLPDRHAVLVLRNTLIKNKTHKQSKLTPKTIQAYIIKAWNSFAAQKPIGALKFADGEQFPVISGNPFGKGDQNPQP